MEKYTFRMGQGGQLRHRPDLGQPPPAQVTGAELADFFLAFLNGTLPLTVKSAPAPPEDRPLPARAGGSSGGGGGGGGDGGPDAGAVRELVGSSFAEAVLDEDRDVAVRPRHPVTRNL